jgi:hypothetical protein
LAASVKINGMKSRLAGGFPSISAFTIDISILRCPYSNALTIRCEHGTTFDLTVGQLIKGLVYLLKTNALNAAMQQSLAGKSQYLAKFLDVAPDAGRHFGFVKGCDRERKGASSQTDDNDASQASCRLIGLMHRCIGPNKIHNTLSTFARGEFLDTRDRLFFAAINDDIGTKLASDFELSRVYIYRDYRSARWKQQLGILYPELPQATSPNDDNSAARIDSWCEFLHGALRCQSGIGQCGSFNKIKPLSRQEITIGGDEQKVGITTRLPNAPPFGNLTQLFQSAVTEAVALSTPTTEDDDGIANLKTANAFANRGYCASIFMPKRKGKT